MPSFVVSIHSWMINLSKNLTKSVLQNIRNFWGLWYNPKGIKWILFSAVWWDLLLYSISHTIKQVHHLVHLWSWKYEMWPSTIVLYTTFHHPATYQRDISVNVATGVQLSYSWWSFSIHDAFIGRYGAHLFIVCFTLVLESFWLLGS